MQKNKLKLVSIFIFTLIFTTNAMANQLELKATEQADLLHLFEEEKLARDTYIYAYNKYKLQIFSNISQSEQTHMNRVKQLLDFYKVGYPSIKKIGEFHNLELQKIYLSLIKQIDKSMMDALKIGAKVEDLDIKDILVFKDRTSKADILQVYNNLECGSRNHLRAFYKQIKQRGSTYTQEFITKDYFAKTLASNKERCGLMSK